MKPIPLEDMGLSLDPIEGEIALTSLIKVSFRKLRFLTLNLQIMVFLLSWKKYTFIMVLLIIVFNKLSDICVYLSLKDIFYIIVNVEQP